MEERSSTDKARARQGKKKSFVTIQKTTTTKKTFVTLGPTGQLVLSANIKKYNVLVLCYSNSFSLDLNGTCTATLHENGYFVLEKHHTKNTECQLPGMPRFLSDQILHPRLINAFCRTRGINKQIIIIIKKSTLIDRSLVPTCTSGGFPLIFS